MYATKMKKQKPRSADCEEIFIYVFIVGMLLYVLLIGVLAASLTFIQRNNDPKITCGDVTFGPGLALGVMALVVVLVGLCNVPLRSTTMNVVVFVMLGVAFTIVMMYFIVLSVVGNVARGNADNPEKWHGIKACFMEKQLCEKFSSSGIGDMKNVTLATELAPLEMNCCKAPVQCGYESNKNWTSLLPYYRDDCKLWGAEKEKKCYDCPSCKDAYIDVQKYALGEVMGYSLVSIIMVTITTLVGCIPTDEEMRQQQRDSKAYNRINRV